MSAPRRGTPSAGCTACPAVASRREALGRISATLVAAMAGVELWPGTAAAVPVLEASGTQTGPSEYSYSLPAADGVAIDRGAQLILVRFQQRVYVFNLACPHENTALRWKEASLRFQCPRHESQYQPDGSFISGRATRNMDRFGLARAGDTLRVDLNRFLRSDQNPGEWAAASLAL